jgi:hypothetical protein
MMPMTPSDWRALHQLVFERLEFPTSDRVDSSSRQQSVEPINEEKPMLKSEIERTTIDNVIRIGTSQVKLDGEFNRSIVIDDLVDTVMEDVVPDHREEKAINVVDSKYLQPRWCPPILLAPKSRSFNDYDLRRCERTSDKSGGMSCSTRSSP